MRYLFRGLRRDTGEPVGGRVTAPSEDAAYDWLGDQGIVVESLTPEDGIATARAPLFAQALEDALDDAGLKIRFDQLARRYEGKSVWVLDRDKIRERVMQLVNEAIGDDESRQGARRHIAQMLEKMFADRRNLGTEQPAESLALKAEVSRLAGALGKLERAMASMSVAWRRDERRVVPQRMAADRTQDEVLVEIFESNLELMRGIDDAASLPENESQANHVV